MSLNEDELLKIEKATSGFFGKTARVAISRALTRLYLEIEATRELSDAHREKALRALVVTATKARHSALQMGARSYKDPEWSAAASCESLLHELLDGTPSGIASVGAIVLRLRTRS